jgi:RimJ/RimL family protein N-acetyltransferase
MKVLEKAGFQLEGILRSSIYKNGKIFDSRLYARIKA